MNNKQHNDERFLQIGELAKKAKVTPRTLKHYEGKGIMLPNKKTNGGFRLYEKEDVKALERIKNLQKAGFSLKEIKEIETIIKDTENINTSHYIDSKKIEDMEKIIQNQLDHINENLKKIISAKKILSDTMRVLKEFKNSNRNR